jgi:hypothetical protein
LTGGLTESGTLLPTFRLTFQPSFDALDGGCGFFDGAFSVFDPLDSSRLRSLHAFHDVFDPRIPFFVVVPKKRHGIRVTGEDLVLPLLPSL